MKQPTVRGAIAALAGTLAILAAATSSGAAAVATSEVTTATVTPTQQVTSTSTSVPLRGDFDGDGRDDIFWYVAGPGADALWSGKERTSPTTIDADRFATQAMAISGTYVPVVGDFDGNGKDDIFWYGKGTAYDSVWYFTGRGTYTSKAFTINGTFQPIAGNFNATGTSTDADDVFLYGSGYSSLWSGTTSRTFLSTNYPSPPPSGAKVYAGNWRQSSLLPGATEHLDLLFYRPGTSSDVIWVGTGTSSFTTSAVTINGTYDPIVGNFNASTGPEMHDIFWYAPGKTQDYVWMNTGSGFTSEKESVNVSTYKPVVVEARGGEQDDILWNNPKGTDYLWKTTGASNAFAYRSINATSTLGDPGTRRPLVADVDAAAPVGGGSSLGLLATSPNHSCGVTAAGGVKCWGNNFDGQFGNGDIESSDSPLDVTGLTSGVKAVTTGMSHTCALTTAGGVKCWGTNSLGQLGDGTLIDRLTPVDVTGLTSGVASISAGDFSTCAVTTTGGAKCWGYNENHQLGDGTTTTRTSPVNVSGLTSGVASISAGGTVTCAVTTTGGAKCWGFNDDGQVGDGTTTDRSTPVNVSGLTSSVASISAGSTHACAITTTGGAKCWGSNHEGHLGNDSTTKSSTPVNVTGLTSGVASISAGYDLTCAVTTASGAMCWGSNTYGGVGSGSQSDDIEVPENVTGLTSGVTTVDAALGHACALTTTGSASCWGYNGFGQLGIDTDTTTSRTPVTVSGDHSWGSVSSPGNPANVDLLWWAPGNGAGQSEILWAELESIS
jgi:alpha-tubulin suppressor-like RCC1 family protein